MIDSDERTILGGFGRFAHLDLPHGTAQPSLARVAVATVVAVVGSMLACWLLATAAVHLDPSLQGYDRFRFADYAKLGIPGVVVACAAWPVVTWCSSQARRVFLLLAVLVTIGSFAPDVWIGIHGQPAAGVWTLVLMHVALLVVTYPALVLIAPQPTGRRGALRR